MMDLGRNRLVSVLFLVSFFSSALRAAKTDDSWDLLIFTQQWPRSVCRQWKETDGNKCYPYPPGIWTIHGIWPNKLGTIGPNNCVPSMPFHPEVLSLFQDQMDQLWSPVYQTGDKNSLWAHEWTKHGTCSLSQPQLSSQQKYFLQGIAWAKIYNMYHLLNAAGIHRGGQYRVPSILSGLEKVLNKRPQLICFEDKKQKSVLLEVRLCFNKTLDLTDCDGTVVANGKSLTNCRFELAVHYPF